MNLICKSEIVGALPETAECIFKTCRVFVKKLFLVAWTDVKKLFYRSLFSDNNKKKSILCWYENDKLLIGHINNLDKWIQIFKEFYAVTGVDLSPCVNADLEQQKMAILLNQLLTAYMASHGVRILANFRTGGFETINSLSGYPLGICYSVGMLGCSKRKVLHGTELMQAKLLNTCPKKLLIYGSADIQLQELMNNFAIPFVVIPDFKTRCFQAKREVTYVK